MTTRWVHCSLCGSEIEPPARGSLTSLCVRCGEKEAREKRKSWCVVAPHKQGPMFITAESAKELVVAVNVKQQR